MVWCICFDGGQGCQKTATIYGRTQAFLRSEANKNGLLRVEADIKRIMDSLNIPILTNIRKGQRRGQETLAAIQTELRALARQVRGVDADEQATWRLLGRVRLDKLKEGGDILGQGTFGVVKSGTYMGQEVAIKKAMGPVGDPAVLSEFRLVSFIMLGNHFGVAHSMWKGTEFALTPLSKSIKIHFPTFFHQIVILARDTADEGHSLVLRRGNSTKVAKTMTIK